MYLKGCRTARDLSELMAVAVMFRGVGLPLTPDFFHIHPLGLVGFTKAIDIHREMHCIIIEHFHFKNLESRGL
ncbi:MAG: hypothetical protein JWR26_4488, partial [Pedosphaera sp.]|nr:hypothetical protein [Pedosphaera sp.]